MVTVYNAQDDMCQVLLREFDGLTRCLVQIDRRITILRRSITTLI